MKFNTALLASALLSVSSVSAGNCDEDYPGWVSYGDYYYEKFINAYEGNGDIRISYSPEKTGGGYANDGRGVTWYEARDHCLAIGTDLLWIEDAAENAWVRDYSDSLRDWSFDPLWIGFNDIDAEGTFEWVGQEDNAALTYSNWKSPKEPNNNDKDQQDGPEDCAEMYGKAAWNGLWNDAECAAPNQDTRSHLKPFICKGGCECDRTYPGWTYSEVSGEGWYYQRFSSWNNSYADIEVVGEGNDLHNDATQYGVVWEKAADYCVSVDASLVFIINDAENTWVRETFDNDIIWIGLNDKKTEGSWSWQGHDSLGVPYTNWKAGEPNENESDLEIGGEDCVEMYYSSDHGGVRYQWNDAECRPNNADKHWHPFVCKGNCAPPPPAGPQ